MLAGGVVELAVEGEAAVGNLDELRDLHRDALRHGAGAAVANVVGASGQALDLAAVGGGVVGRVGVADRDGVGAVGDLNLPELGVAGSAAVRDHHGRVAGAGVAAVAEVATGLEVARPAHVVGAAAVAVRAAGVRDVASRHGHRRRLEVDLEQDLERRQGTVVRVALEGDTVEDRVVVAELRRRANELDVELVVGRDEVEHEQGRHAEVVDVGVRILRARVGGAVARWITIGEKSSATFSPSTMMSKPRFQPRSAKISCRRYGVPISMLSRSAVTPFGRPDHRIDQGDLLHRVVAGGVTEVALGVPLRDDVLGDQSQASGVVVLG